MAIRASTAEGVGSIPFQRTKILQAKKKKKKKVKKVVNQLDSVKIFTNKLEP